MFGLQILDIAIGLIFVYLLLALICTTASELLAGLFNRRSRNLFIGIRGLLEEETVRRENPKDPDDLKGKGLVDLFYAHPLIKALHGQRIWGEGKSKPSYIPSRTFALALLDIIDPANPDRDRKIDDIRWAIKALPGDSDIRRTLLILLDEAKSDLGKLQRGIEAWFNNAMDRASGWYKRRTQVIVFVIAVVMTTAVNADTIQIAKTLANDPALREALVAQAQEFAKNPPPASQGSGAQPQANSAGGAATGAAISHVELIKENTAALQNLGLKLGWQDESKARIDWVNKIFGLLLTALAVSMGAPFWFDMLNKIISVRATGKPPKEATEAQGASAQK
ncbi:MAG TPA: hypothetical protein VFV58_25020 [Blastocatellia bacterium]|jgi:hypothetical protein|nr:hypothetical protein [Blastocatellia bacterium]